jgi:DNA-binding response OmpR family regulator
MAKILIVEDDPHQGDNLSIMLEHEGYTFDLVVSGEDALHLLKTYSYDLLILDWGLPGISGMDVCQQYRNSNGVAPVLMLTARDDKVSIATGLDRGADDYVAKPYNIMELAARIRSLLRRPPGYVKHTLQADGIEFDIGSKVARVGEHKTELSQREAALLEFLLRHPNRTFRSKALLDAVWPLESAISEDTVRSCMRHLRNKLSEGGNVEIIKTVPGGGYMISKLDQ